MAPTEFKDLPSVREQILANVSVAFPTLNAGQCAGDMRYTIITRLTESGDATAMVVYGGRNEVFATSEAAPSIADALSKLLDVTSLIIDELFDSGDLMTIGEDDSASHVCGIEGSAYKVE